MAGPPQPIGLHLRLTLTDGLTSHAESVTTILPHSWVGMIDEGTAEKREAVVNSAFRDLLRRWSKSGEQP